MSCGNGCGCCPKCGCHRQCTCKRKYGAEPGSSASSIYRLECSLLVRFFEHLDRFFS